MGDYVNKKNLYRLKTHMNARRQLEAIDTAKRNINSNNNVKINLK